MHKVSVIIPVYNVEKYLPECLDSVLNQTYKNLEIICVNDCSPDNCDKILASYAAKDSRIKIINNKKNGGYSAARNTGLSEASGKYVYFIDSDDWIDSSYIEELVQKLEEKNVDIVLNNNIVEEFENISKDYIWERYLIKNPEGEICSSAEAINKTPCMVWCHLYKRDLLIKNKLKFPLGYIFEDEYFNYVTNMNTDNVFVYYVAQYHDRHDKTSFIANLKNRTLPSLKIWHLVCDYIMGNNINLYPIKMFVPSTVAKIIDENEFQNVKKYITKIQDIYLKQKHLYNDYERFFIRNVIESSDFTEYKKKIGSDAALTYKTRYKIQREKNIKISIIIPVYNVAMFLPKCLDSVCTQTLRDIEIICINDCSSDNSLDILKIYQKYDNRIKIIDFKENKGVAATRNTGIEAAKGKYIGFVDSDDWIDPDFYEKLYNKVIENNADLVVGNIKRVQKGKASEIDNYAQKTKENKVNFNGWFYLGLYNKQLLKNNNICFTERLIYGEDRVFPILAAYYANKVETVCDSFYYYHIRDNSASRKFYNNPKKLTDFCKSSKLVLECFNKLNYDEKSYNLFIEQYLKYIITTLVSAPAEYKNDIAEIYSNFYNNLKFNTFDKNIYDKINTLILKKDFTGVEKINNQLQKEELLNKLRSNLQKAKGA